MKKIFTSLFICTILFACKNQKNTDQSDSDSTNAGESSETEKKISKRDYSINASNAYNNLFLDSVTVQDFIKSQKLNDTIARRMLSFYNARNYNFAWFASDGLTEQARAFWSLLNYYTTYSGDTSLKDKKLKTQIDNLALQEELKVDRSDQSFTNAELKLTKSFIEYSLKNYRSGILKRKEMERFVPLKKVDAMFQADSLLSKKHKDNKYFEDANQPYKLLKEQLQKYYTIAKNGGWQPITASPKKIKKGISSPVILALKKRLQATGDMPANDTTDLYNDELENGIKVFQQRYGYTPDGVITAGLLKEMNVPAVQRVQQILINLNRMRWMPSEPDGNLITVNIPEFILHVYEGKNKAFDMKVVVGKEGHNTTMFTGNLNQIVFSPYWNLTTNIIKDEIMPAMSRDRNYLEKHNMEIIGNNNGIPVIRQLPGKENSLGKVKFLFPNDYNIYFHDTPAKSLFEKDKRAYSHGCIRLSDPVKMANYLLRDNKDWTPERIDSAMNSDKEKYVKLKKPVPVLIFYATAWVDDNGLLNFREDIYGHDAVLTGKMFN